MTGNELVVRIRGDLSDLEKKMKQGSASLDDFSEAEQRAIEQALRLKRANENASRSYEGLSKNTGASLVVFQEFNRTVQDAPFGMMGVGNNLQQLASNFGALSTKMGGTGAALKEVGRSMITGLNPAILAVTALTTAWTLYEMGFFDSKETTKDFNEQLDDFVKNLDGVRQAAISGAAAAEKEAQSINLLRMQAEDANVPMEERLEAVAELQKQAPDYLGNLTKEQILTGDVGDAYEKLANRIIATAKARAFSDKIAENSLKIFQVEERTIDRVNQILEKRKQIEEANALAESLKNKAGETARIEREAAIGRAIRLENEITELGKEQVKDVEVVRDINAENDTLTNKIADQIKNGAVFTKDLKAGTDEAKEAFKKFSDAWDEFNAKTFREAREEYEKFKKDLEESVKSQEKFDALTQSIVDKIKESEKMNGEDPFGVSAMLARMGTPVKDEAKPYDPTEDLEKVRAEAALTEAAFDGLGQAVGLAFGSGNEWGRFLSSFIKFAGEVIAQNFAMSKANIITAGTQTGLATGPAAAFATPGIIASGLALIGSLFAAVKGGSSSGGGGTSSISKAYGLPGREKGGPVRKGQAYLVGEKRPEVFVPNTNGMIIPRVNDFASMTASAGIASSSQKIDIEVYGVIDGETIRLTNRKAERRVNKT